MIAFADKKLEDAGLDFQLMAQRAQSREFGGNEVRADFALNGIREACEHDDFAHAAVTGHLKTGQWWSLQNQPL